MFFGWFDDEVETNGWEVASRPASRGKADQLGREIERRSKPHRLFFYFLISFRQSFQIKQIPAQHPPLIPAHSRRKLFEQQAFSRFFGKPELHSRGCLWSWQLYHSLEFQSVCLLWWTEDIFRSLQRMCTRALQILCTRQGEFRGSPFAFSKLKKRLRCLLRALFMLETP